MLALTIVFDPVDKAEDSLLKENDCREDAKASHVDQKEQKVLEVSMPYAVADPTTVMVHAQDAAAALAAVVGPRRLRAVTLFAEGHELGAQIFYLDVRKSEAFTCKRMRRGEQKLLFDFFAFGKEERIAFRRV